MNKELLAYVQKNKLPQQYLNIIQVYILPLAVWIKQRKHAEPLVVGINGAQGSGKSTLTGALAIILNHLGYDVAQLSIDDLYLLQEQRQTLASTVHPLLKTRGVPGTHDVKLGLEIITKLTQGRGEVSVPKFDKRVDDRAPKQDWQLYTVPVDIVLFEGWCVGTPPQPADALHTPMNELDTGEDQEGVWREFVNASLANTYQQLFQHIDVLVYLQVPSFDSVFLWRQEQEEKLFQNQQANGYNQQGMSTDELKRFIAHYERLSRWAMQALPLLADVVITLDELHRISKVSYKKT